jgi:hypothetical protein
MITNQSNEICPEQAKGTKTAISGMLPRPGTVYRKLKNVAAHHRVVSVLMWFVDLVLRLDIGSVCVTVETQASVNPGTIRRLLIRHRRCDWGDVSSVQRRFNDAAFSLHRGTIHSTYAADEREVHVLTFACFCCRWIRRRTLVCMKSELYFPRCECIWIDFPLELRPRNDKMLPLGVRNALNQVLAFLRCEGVEPYRTTTTEQRATHQLKSVSILTEWFFASPSSRAEPCPTDELFQPTERFH